MHLPKVEFEGGDTSHSSEQTRIQNFDYVSVANVEISGTVNCSLAELFFSCSLWRVFKSRLFLFKHDGLKS